MKRSLLPLLLLLAGCASTGEEEDRSSMASTGATDVQTMAITAESVAAELPSLGNSSTLAEGSFAGLGDCTWSYAVEGTVLSGDIELALHEVPCGGAYSGEEGSGSYEVVSGAMSGDYTQSGGTWSLGLSGSRQASLALETARRGARSYDMSWTLGSLDAETDGSTLGAWSLALEYDGLGDRVWSLETSGDGDGAVTGTLTGPNGTACTVGGTAAAVEVSCE